MTSIKQKVNIIGGGLAGCEAALYLANKGVAVTLYEMRPLVSSPAHVGGLLGELVCSNSLKSDLLDTAAGMLKREMGLFSSIILEAASHTKVPAGGALAVDREKFAQYITDKIENHKNITLIRQEVIDIPKDGVTMLACGPLPSDAITNTLQKLVGDSLSFVDAISPVICAESIDLTKGFFAGRYGKGGDDYFNIPLDKEQYTKFYNALLTAPRVRPHEFEDEKVFERCMPIETLADRGVQTLLFGPMRPVGLEDPNSKERAHAVVQLRAENLERTAFNIVGFQSRMTIPAQQEVFRMLPSLENCEFLRYATIHRNSYIDAPKLLNSDFSFKDNTNLFVIGQLSGVEGYLESAASGLIAAIQLWEKLNDKPSISFPAETAFGALIRHISGEFGDKTYTPGNFHFGMLPPLEGVKVRDKKTRKSFYSERGYDSMTKLLKKI